MGYAAFLLVDLLRKTLSAQKLIYVSDLAQPPRRAVAAEFDLAQASGSPRPEAYAACGAPRLLAERKTRRSPQQAPASPQPQVAQHRFAEQEPAQNKRHARQLGGETDRQAKQSIQDALPFRESHAALIDRAAYFEAQLAASSRLAG